MSNKHLKGFSKLISYSQQERLITGLLLEFNRSRRTNLELPKFDEKFDESLLEKMEDFKGYVLSRFKIKLKNKYTEYINNIIDYQDSKKSILKACIEIETAKNQVNDWKLKVSHGLYGIEKKEDKNYNFFYLFKYEVYFNLLRLCNGLLRDVALFLEKNYIEELKEVNRKNDNQTLKTIIDYSVLRQNNFEKDFLTVNEAMEFYGVSRGTLDNWARKDSNPLKKSSNGGRVYFNKIDNFFDKD